MPADVVDLIMQDHREVERLFEELKQRPEKRPNLVPVLTTLLTAHSRAEEALVYPAARDEAGETEEIAHSQEEHIQTEKLLEQLAAADPGSKDFDQVLNTLTEAVNKHVHEEESQVLPGMKEQLSEERRVQLGKAFVASRKEHFGEQPGQATKEELQAQAHNLGVSGASQMSKQELERQMKSR